MKKKYIGIRWYSQRQDVVECIIANGINVMMQDSDFGVVYCEEMHKGTKIISSNDWENSRSLPDVVKQTLSEKSIPLNDSVIIDLSKDCYNNVYETLSELGEVQELHIKVRSMIQSTFFYENTEQRLFDKLDVLSGEIFASINMFSGNSVIKRELCFCVKEDLSEQIMGAVNSILYEYKDKIKLEKINIKNGLYDIVLPSGRGGILIHETIGHSLEADHFFDSKNCLNSMLGKKLFDTNISISDTCSEKDMLSYEYSADGSLVKNVDLVKKGSINGILSDQTSSKLWSIPDTGNGRVSDYGHLIIPRMRNTFLHNGNYDKNDIFSDTYEGIYALEIGGGRTNIQTGEFVFNILRGCLIRDGEFVGITDPFLYKGKIIDTLNKVDMIANDLSFEFGYCGKQSQLVPVSYGQPTIRVSKYRFGD